jgi:hypothetical protein
MATALPVRAVPCPINTSCRPDTFVRETAVDDRKISTPDRRASEGTASGGSRSLSQLMPIVPSLARLAGISKALYPCPVVSKARGTSSDHQKIRANKPNTRTTDRRHEENESATPASPTDASRSALIPTIRSERTQILFQTQPSSDKEVSYIATRIRPARTNPTADLVRGCGGPARERCKTGARPLGNGGGPEQTNPFGPGGDETRSPRRRGLAIPIRSMRRPVRMGRARVETAASRFGFSA